MLAGGCGEPANLCKELAAYASGCLDQQVRPAAHCDEATAAHWLQRDCSDLQPGKGFGSSPVVPVAGANPGGGYAGLAQANPYGPATSGALRVETIQDQSGLAYRAELPCRECAITITFRLENVSGVVNPGAALEINFAQAHFAAIPIDGLQPSRTVQLWASATGAPYLTVSAADIGQATLSIALQVGDRSAVLAFSGDSSPPIVPGGNTLLTEAFSARVSDSPSRAYLITIPPCIPTGDWDGTCARFDFRIDGAVPQSGQLYLAHYLGQESTPARDAFVDLPRLSAGQFSELLYPRPGETHRLMLRADDLPADQDLQLQVSVAGVSSPPLRFPAPKAISPHCSVYPCTATLALRTRSSTTARSGFVAIRSPGSMRVVNTAELIAGVALGHLPLLHPNERLLISAHDLGSGARLDLQVAQVFDAADAMGAVEQPLTQLSFFGP